MLARRLLALMLLALPVLAQEEQAKEELIGKASELFGIPPGSRFYNAFEGQLKRGMAADLKAEKEEQRTGVKKRRVIQSSDSKQLSMLYPVVSEDAPVLKHYRGTEGIPLPRPEELVTPFQNLPVDDLKKELTEKYMPEYQKAYEELLKNPSLPTCKESRTFKTEVDDSLGREHDDQVFFDVLYLPPELKPLNPETYFGPTATLRTYTNVSGNAVSIVARTLGVWCLPYRIRVTGKNRFIHTGADALRNFEKNPNGHGELNKDLEKQIEYLGIYSDRKSKRK